MDADRSTADQRQMFANGVAHGRHDLVLTTAVMNCPDPMPPAACQALGLPDGATFAQSADLILHQHGMFAAAR